MHQQRGFWILTILACHTFWVNASLLAADQPQWGQVHSRNMVSGESGLPVHFNPETGENIKWIAPLGSETWATPIVAQGRVFIGTNNHPPRDARNRGDRGVLLCLDETDGHLHWQLVVPKLGPDRFLDWPNAGIVSPPTVAGDRVYVVTNRGEVVCLDLQGQRNGNDGPFQDEGRHMTPADDPALEVTDLDADILWLFDIPNQAGTHPHDSAHSSILLDGDYLYINTSNGVDNTHRKIRKPEGPSLIVLDRHTGRYLARDREGIGPRIFHSTWSSPALGTVNGQKQILFGGGDGVIYAFAALEETPAAGLPASLRKLWSFDCDPTGPKEDVQRYLGNRKESPSNIKGMPVFHQNRLYVAVGGDIWWGKNQAWLKCLDATGQGDVTATGEIWSYEVGQHCVATPAVHAGLVYVTDCTGMIHCVDSQTGQAYWTHKAKGDLWASPLVADGKVYTGTRRREFLVFKAGKEKELLADIRLDSAMAASPCAANGVLYVTSMKKLYAVAIP